MACVGIYLLLTRDYRVHLQIDSIQTVNEICSFCTFFLWGLTFGTAGEGILVQPFKCPSGFAQMVGTILLVDGGCECALFHYHFLLLLHVYTILNFLLKSLLRQSIVHGSLNLLAHCLTLIQLGAECTLIDFL